MKDDRSLAKLTKEPQTIDKTNERIQTIGKTNERRQTIGKTIPYLSIRVKGVEELPVIKNNVRILKKPHAYLQTILKTPVKFQKDRLKTVVGVTGTRYLLSIHFCSIRTNKISKLKMWKK